jgi:hypothetical protein
VARNHRVYNFDSAQGKMPSGSSKWARGFVRVFVMVQSLLYFRERETVLVTLVRPPPRAFAAPLGMKMACRGRACPTLCLVAGGSRTPLPGKAMKKLGWRGP